MRIEQLLRAVQDFLEGVGTNGSDVETLIAEDQIWETEHRAQEFYRRKILK